MSLGKRSRSQPALFAFQNRIRSITSFENWWHLKIIWLEWSSRRCVACKYHVSMSKVKVTVPLTVCAWASCVQPITSPGMRFIFNGSIEVTFFFRMAMGETPHTCTEWMGDWLAMILRPFNSISIILGRWVGNNEKLCAVEPRLRFKRLPPPTCLQHGTAKSAGQRFNYWGTGAPTCTMFVFKLKELLNRTSLKGVPFCGGNILVCA